MPNFKKEISYCADQLRDKISEQCDTALILGSGLGDLEINGFEESKSVSYKEIYGLPESTAPSHQGRFRLLTDGEQNLLVCSGRHHLYEGYSAREVCTLIFVLKQFGISRLIISSFESQNSSPGKGNAPLRYPVKSLCIWLAKEPTHRFLRSEPNSEEKITPL